MPRRPMSGAEKVQMVDKLALGAIVSAIPRKQIEVILNRTKTNSIRNRILPSFLVVYLVILISMYPNVSIKETLRIMLEKLRNLFGARAITIAVGSAITKARRRLGIDPFKHLYEEIVKPEGFRDLEGSYYRKWLIVGVDGCTATIQNTQENLERFGSYKNQYGDAGNPSIKWVALMACHTRIIFGVTSGAVNKDEKEFYRPLIEHLTKDMILLADRHYYDYGTWMESCQSGAALLWRVRSDLKLVVTKKLKDGSCLSEIKPTKEMRKRLGLSNEDKTTVRVIVYRATFEDNTESEEIRLVTNILDPEQAPAEELAELYADRWQVETAFDELKSSLGEDRRVLRSQLPELVVQEFYGFLMAYYIVRKLMAESAKKGGVKLEMLSFIHSVRVIRRKISEAFFPSGESEETN
jgi:hypothetical protein